jgi:predicted ATPase
MQVCPNLTLLVTTRELLRITGEVEYAVPPLAEPEAVALFCERGQLEPSEEIAELCACLDSLPLAVELAAARTKALSPAQILARLSQRLDLLKGGRDADPRQQTLRATIGWSYDLLSPHEQELFARCSVFAGGCTLEAAEEVCDADLDTLQSLVEKSLLRFSNERYWMLETIREYASTAFGEEEALAVYPRHARFYKALAERAGERMAERLRGDILIELENELPNLRGALAWFRSSDSHADELQLHRALKKFWLARDHVAEGENLLKEALVRIPDDASDDRMRVELALGEIMMRRGRPEEARPSVERWLRWARSGGNVSEAAWALSSLASLSMRDGDFTTSLPLLDDALGLARETGDVAQISHVLGNLGYTLTGLGDYERAVDMCRESIGMAPTAPDSAIDHANLGLALLGLGDVDGAGDAYRVATAYALESGHFFALADALVGVAAVLAARGDSRSALVVLAAVDKLRTDLGLPAEPLELDLDSRTAATARALLGHEAVQAWDAGRALTVDEAVEYALASID